MTTHTTPKSVRAALARPFGLVSPKRRRAPSTDSNRHEGHEQRMLNWIKHYERLGLRGNQRGGTAA